MRFVAGVVWLSIHTRPPVMRLDPGHDNVTSLLEYIWLTGGGVSGHSSSVNRNAIGPGTPVGPCGPCGPGLP